MFQNYTFATFILIVTAVASRFIPHPPNFTPLIAISLFSGAMISNRLLALSIPILAMFLSDIIIGFHDLMLPIYAIMASIALLGRTLHSNRTFLKVAGVGLSGSMLFFILSNFFVWLKGFWSVGLYPLTMEGLIQCYIMAIPFYHYQLAGDVIYIGILFGLMHYIERKFLLVEQSQTLQS